MAPPTSSHLYWKPLRALGLLLDIPALVIIIVASRKVTDSTFGIIGVSIIVNRFLLFIDQKIDWTIFFHSSKLDWLLTGSSGS